MIVIKKYGAKYLPMILSLSLFSTTTELKAQRNKNLAVDVGLSVGSNYGLFESENYLSLQNGLQLTVFFHKNFFAKSTFSLSSLKGYHHQSQTEFYNSFTTLTTGAGYAIQSFREKGPLKHLGMRLAIGASIMSSYVHVSSSNRSYAFRWPFYSYYTSLDISLRLSDQVNVFAGTDLYLTETKWLDGIPDDNKLDNLLVPHLGFSYKITGKYGNEIESPIRDEEYDKILQRFQRKLISRNENQPNDENEVQAQQDNNELISKIDSLNTLINLLVKNKPETHSPEQKYEIYYNQNHGEKDTILVKLTDGSNRIEKYVIHIPEEKYNIICGGYIKLPYAIEMQEQLSKKGIKSTLIKKSKTSKLVLISVYSTNNKREALQKLNRLRIDLNTKVWLYISTHYN